jgi:hypothetical protein
MIMQSSNWAFFGKMPNKQEYLTRQEIRREIKISKKTAERAALQVEWEYRHEYTSQYSFWPDTSVGFA